MASDGLCTVYKATCSRNGKSYVGFDSNWPARKSNHELQAALGCNYKFYRAIRKHGWATFEWEVLYQSLDRKHCLKTMEPYFIALHDSFHGGYNSSLGGEGPLGYRHTAEARAKISAAGRGRKLSPEHIAKIAASKLLPEYAAKMRGKKLSPEHRARLSVAGTGKRVTSEHAAKISAAKKGHRHTLETRAKISAAGRGRKLSAEHRAKISAAGRGRKLSSRQIAKMREHRHTPETLAKMRGREFTPEHRAKIGAARLAKTLTIRDKRLGQA